MEYPVLDVFYQESSVYVGPGLVAGTPHILGWRNISGETHLSFIKE